MRFCWKETGGGGKTDVLLMDFAKNVGRGWGASWKGVLFRENFPDLQDVISKSLKWFSQIFPDARYNRSNHMWQFATGEQLFFRHARVPDDYWNFHGHEYPWIGWEELTNWATPDLYLMMMSCNRTSDPRVTKRIISTCNPWGCVPFGNVLTVDNGFVPIQDIKKGDYVWSMDKKGNMVKKKVLDTIAYEYDGEMIKEQTAGRYMEFTADHRLPIYNVETGEHELKHYNKIEDEVFNVRTAVKFQNDTFSIDKNEYITIDKKNLKTTNVQNQMVYCLSVEDTETFFVKQRGYIWLTGNCGHN